jgi:ADP-ribose pyrophosphatase
MAKFDDASIIETTVSSEHVFDGLILHIDHITNRLPNGKLAAREVARHVGASAVVPVDAEGNVWLVKQFRAPIDRVLLEVPAGKLDYKGEDRLLAAKRELEEETGLTAKRWTHLTDIVTTPGFSDELISLYLAQDLEAGRSHPDDDEFLNVVKVPLEELVAMIARGEVTDAKSICAVLLAATMAFFGAWTRMGRQPKVRRLVSAVVLAAASAALISFSSKPAAPVSAVPLMARMARKGISLARQAWAAAALSISTHSGCQASMISWRPSSAMNCSPVTMVPKKAG